MKPVKLFQKKFMQSLLLRRISVLAPSACDRCLCLFLFMVSSNLTCSNFCHYGTSPCHFILLFFLTFPPQIRFASVDMELHTTYDPYGSLSIYDVDRRVAERTQVLAPLPEDRFLCSFSHIFAGLQCCLTYQVVEFMTRWLMISLTLSFIDNLQVAMLLDTTVTR
jgi:hypothetical protein